ncbi:MAG: type IV toxin-antitoxin system AbiEi family antitoxin domain-containing protein [Bacteroidetes bacterium]|nr:type IV toxin-antitoxin system AbiEi family antitoxin domain-containing protein [Bacteroidota bacterium]
MAAPIEIPTGRLRLISVIQKSGRVIRTDDFENTLRVDRSNASTLLLRWRSQGWLRRAGPGVYVQVPIEFMNLVPMMLMKHLNLQRHTELIIMDLFSN